MGKRLAWWLPGYGLDVGSSGRVQHLNRGFPQVEWGEDQTHCFWLEHWKHSVFSPYSLIRTICRKVLFLLWKGNRFLPSPNSLQNTNSAFYWLSSCAVLNRVSMGFPELEKKYCQVLTCTRQLATVCFHDKKEVL